jgi:hypothetical protein
MAVFYRSLILNCANLRVIARRIIDPKIGLSIVANFNLAFFAWSTRFVDVSVTAILFEIWPIYIILITARLFRGDTRYREITSEMVLLLALGLIGFAFVVGGQAGGFADIQTGGLSLLIVGVVLAVFGAIATSFSAFGFRWGTDVASELPATSREGVSPIPPK